MSLHLLSVQDPESLDVIQSISYSSKSRDLGSLGGDYASAISSKLKDKFSRKPEPNFTSFLYSDTVSPDGDQQEKPVEKDHSRLVCEVGC